MQALILAAGEGARLGMLTRDLPEPPQPGGTVATASGRVVQAC